MLPSHLDLQPFFADRIVLFQLGGRAFEDDDTVAHNVNPIGDVHCDRELLFDQQCGHATTGDFL